METKAFKKFYKYSEAELGRDSVAERDGIVAALQQQTPFMLRTCYYFMWKDERWMYACHFGYDGEEISEEKIIPVKFHVVRELPEFDENCYYMIRGDLIILCDYSREGEERDIHIFVMA